MRGIVVSVEFGDLLAITLPRNARHFTELLVVTSVRDEETQAVVAQVPNARCLCTEAFYARGAEFNKGLAMEEGFEALGRHGWLTILDADTLLPDLLDWEQLGLTSGNLYVPPRRILANPASWLATLDWAQVPLKDEPARFPGYCQIFHAADPFLATTPWYATDWRHAGGSDTAFQSRWPLQHKLRSNFEVLHLGEDGKNWYGRATRRLDGTLPREAPVRAAAIAAMYRRRRNRGRRYRGEKLE